MIEELKPCPMTVFPWLPEHELRIVDGLQASNGAPIEYAAGCVDCDIYTDQCRTRDEAIAAWNTRTAYDPDKRLRDALEIAEEALDQLLDDMGASGLCVCLAAKAEAQTALSIARAALSHNGG